MWQVPAVALVCLLLGGCSWFTWLPWVDGDDEKDANEPAELVDFDHEVTLARQWRARIGEGLGKKYLRLKPAIVADRIIAADGYGRVEALNRFTGKRIWQTRTHELDAGFLSGLNVLDRMDPSFISGGVGVGEGLALLGTTDGEVVALDVAEGTQRWVARLGSEVLAIPAAADGRVFTQTIDGRMIALDADSGEVIWTYDNQVPILTLRGTSSPVVREDVVYGGFANGKVMAFRTSNGEPVWEHRVMLPEGRSELDRIVDVDMPPLVTPGGLYVGSYHGRVKGLTLREGRPLWEHKLSTYLDLAVGYGLIYAIDDEDIVTAIDQNTGEVAWQQDAFRLRQLSPPVAFSNYLVFGDAEGHLHVLAQRDGRLMGRRKLDGDGIRSGIALAESTLYVLGNSGALHALEVELK